MNEEKRQLTAADILSVEDLEVTEVAVPEWKGSVYLRVLPADVGLALNEKMVALPKEKASESMFLLLGACLVDRQGSPLFTTDEQFAKLRTRSGKVLLRLQDAALELQGWRRDGAGAASPKA